MKLSNRDWNKSSSIWFILLPAGHEGPYSLDQLEQMQKKGKISSEIKIWKEGLDSPLTLSDAGQRQENDLPPLPEEESLPPLPEEVPEIPHEEKKTSKRWGLWFLSFIVLLGVGFFLIASRTAENFKILRYPKMSLELHERIVSENGFKGWSAPLFFKEYLPLDHSQIWLVTSSFHECEIEAHFQSIKDKLLSKDDENISFRSDGHLKNHIVELDRFEFLTGNRLVPGMYEMDLKATHCRWNGILPLVMNAFQEPSEEYLARAKVVLFAQGSEEFTNVLDRLLKEKRELQLKEQNENEIFWQDLEQKFETLEAITLQIEQLMLDNLDSGPAKFYKNINKMVDEYTRKYGSFLTSFVVENENYFNSLTGEAKGASMKRNYELMVRLSAKRIGLESMKFIEEFQAMKKKPSKKEISQIEERLKKVFSELKSSLTEKLSQVSEDRAH